MQLLMAGPSLTRSLDVFLGLVVPLKPPGAPQKQLSKLYTNIYQRTKHKRYHTCSLTLGPWLHWLINRFIPILVYFKYPLDH